MTDEHMVFKRFAEQQLKSAFFAAQPNDPNSDHFYWSLESTRVLTGWTGKCRNRRGLQFDLHAGFVDTMRPNALADCWQDKQFAAMHSALFIAINEFSLFCFTQRGFFSDVGNPSLEISPSPWDERVPGIWLMDHTLKGGHVEEVHKRQLVPKDEHRKKASWLLALLMARFIWLHELAHCFNGHVDYAKRHDLAHRLYELADGLPLISTVSRLSAEERSETLKCIEFDADQSALWASCNIQHRDLENVEEIRVLDKTLRMRLTLFGAYAVVWLIDEFQNYLDAENSDTHPTPTLRLHNLFRTLESNVMALDDDITLLNAEVLRQFDAISKAVPGFYSSDDLTTRMRDSSLMEALQTYDPRADDLKEQLKDFEFSVKH